MVKRKKYYKPLPDCLTIRESGISGLGLFATQDIEGGKVLGLTHLYDWSFEDNYIRTPLGGFINHSETPNCELEYTGDIDYHPWEERYTKKNTSHRRLVTITKIPKGQELTAKYDIYDPTE